jgi:general secretion pathway protein D
VIIKDGNTVVIGGLIEETGTEGTTGVPCLADIPLLGWLFKSVSKSDSKTNLFIFLTPHIVENPREAAAVYEEKKEEIEKSRGGAIKMYKRPEPEVEGTEFQ